MTNPIIAEVTRGGIVESRHTGAFAVVDGDGKLIKSAGDFARSEERRVGKECRL